MTDELVGLALTCHPRIASAAWEQVLLRRLPTQT